MTRAAPNRRLTVCLLSAHPLVLEELQRLLSPADFRLQTRRLESALPPELRHLRLPRAQVYVVDAQGPRLATEALLAGILEHFPGVRVLVVGEKFSEAAVFPLLRLGIKGFLRYGEICERLPEALKVVAGGSLWMPRALLARFVDSLLVSVGGRRHMPVDLSRREREVLEALLENLSNKEIGERLHISERTVKFHVSNLLARLGKRRRADLILQFWQARSAAS